MNIDSNFGPYAKRNHIDQLHAAGIAFKKLGVCSVGSTVQTKGGVGKTTKVYHNGYCFAQFAGLKVCLVDLDQRCDLSDECLPYEDLEHKANTKMIYKTDPDDNRYTEIQPVLVKRFVSGGELWVIQADEDMTDIDNSGNAAIMFKLKKWIDSQREHFDIILMDNPGVLGLITMSSLISSNFFMSPLEMTPRGRKGVWTIGKYFQDVLDMNPKLEFLGFLPFNVDERQKYYKTTKADLAEKGDDAFLFGGDYKYQIKNRAAIKGCQGKRYPVWLSPEKRDEGTQAATDNLLTTALAILNRIIEVTK